MNRAAVRRAVALARARSKDSVVDQADMAVAVAHERCIQRYALSVASIPPFLSYPVETDRSTVAIASAR